MAKSKILIVEGVEVRGRALDMTLGQIGEFETLLVSSVTDALIKIKAEPFDLVLANTEVSKPGDGLKLAQIILLRNVVAKPPLVIMVTKEKDQELVCKCRQIGVVDYIVYPYDPVNLLKRVSDSFDQHKGMTKEQVHRSIAATLKKSSICPLSPRFKSGLQIFSPAIDLLPLMSPGLWRSISLSPPKCCA